VEALGLDAAGDIFTLGGSNLPSEAEFSPAGVPDAHVTAAPITTSSPSPVSENGGPVAFLPTGQTLVGGSVFVSGSARIQDDDAQVQRLNADGTLDTTFGNGGAEPAVPVPATLLAGLPDATLLAVLPNGEFLAIGSALDPTTLGTSALILTRYFQ
jgi:hypothetical protein